jgi:hypothetical protein
VLVGPEVSDAEMVALPIKSATSDGDCNYTLLPRIEDRQSCLILFRLLRGFGAGLIASAVAPPFLGTVPPEILRHEGKHG